MVCLDAYYVCTSSRCVQVAKQVCAILEREERAVKQTLKLRYIIGLNNIHCTTTMSYRPSNVVRFGEKTVLGQLSPTKYKQNLCGITRALSFSPKLNSFFIQTLLIKKKIQMEGPKQDQRPPLSLMGTAWVVVNLLMMMRWSELALVSLLYITVTSFFIIVDGGKICGTVGACFVWNVRGIVLQTTLRYILRYYLYFRHTYC